MITIPNPTFQCLFDFHSVGQGLFYSGRINQLRFVYDCGSNSGRQYLDKAINQYTDRYGSEQLSLLIVSHFHQDHINGINQLLSKTGGAEEVVLPYLFPEERLMVAAGYAIDQGLDTLDDDYIAFLADPTGFFGTSENINRLTVLRPGNIAERQETAADQQPGIYGWLPDEAMPLSEFPELATHANHNKITIRSHHSVLRVPQWGFKFYCQPGRATREDIVRELGALTQPITVDDIPRVLSDRLADLKDVYYSLFGGTAGQNSTSIVCCHGPAVPRGRRIRIELDLKFGGTIGSNFLDCLLQRSFYCDGFVWVDGSTSSPFLLPPMTLLTGDVNLKLSEFEAHFNDELQGIGLTALAHHGSEHNFRRDFPSVMPNCRCWVVSFGLGNKYRHPSKSVIDHLTDQDLTLLQCNESQGVSFTLEGRIS